MLFSPKLPSNNSFILLCSLHSVKAISQCGISDMSEENTIRLARYLEKQLLKSSPNMRSYSNVYTIDERVKKACTALAYRILAKKRIQSGAKGNKSISKGCIQEAKLKSIYKGWECGGMFC